MSCLQTKVLLKKLQVTQALPLQGLTRKKVPEKMVFFTKKKPKLSFVILHCSELLSLMVLIVLGA